MRMSKFLGEELLEMNLMIDSQEKEIEVIRVKAAKWKAHFFGKRKLADKIDCQDSENLDALTGAFDGFCYCSRRANAVFRTLEDMLNDGILTKEEYGFCDSI